MTFDLDDFLLKSHKAQASDIHLNCGKAPSLRINGEIYKITSSPITHEDIHTVLEKTLPKEYLKKKDELKAKYAEFMLVRNDVLKALENARNAKVIGKSFSAKLSIKPTEAVKTLLDSMNINLQRVFIVSDFELVQGELEGETFDSGIILVTPAQGVICSRCWQVVPAVNEDELCPRCHEILNK